MAGAAPEGKSKYTYQRRMVPMIGGVMIALYLATFIVLCISCASTEWITISPEMDTSQTTAEGESSVVTLPRSMGLWKFCHGSVEDIPGVPDCYALGDTINDPLAAQLGLNMTEEAYKQVSAVRGLQIWCILITLLPVPLVVLAMTKNMNYGLYAHAPVLFWLVFWIPLTVVYKNAAHDALINSSLSAEGAGYWHNQPTLKAYNSLGPSDIDPALSGKDSQLAWLEANVGLAQFYTSGALLNFAAVALMLLSLLVFWSSYFLCFQVDVYDENGEKVDMEELMRKRSEKPEANREHV